MKIIGDTIATGEFFVVTLRSHFDEHTIAPWRGNGPLVPSHPSLTLVDSNGRRFLLSAKGQCAWEAGHGKPYGLGDPLRPGESYETTWVFDVPEDAQSLRMLAELRRFPTCVLIGDEASPRHGKTYFAL